MDHLPGNLERKLTRLGDSLVNIKRAQTLVEPTQNLDGFWFGGGNCARDPHDGSLLLIGRYRDAGDSRTGLGQGTRGRELAIIRSSDNGRSFDKVLSWDKSDLYCGSAVLSIEGSALRVNKRRIACIDGKTGEVKWADKDVKGEFTQVSDDLLIVRKKDKVRGYSLK